MKRVNNYIRGAVAGLLGFAILIGLAGMPTATAQVDRTKYPEAGPAPQINIGEPATFTLANGLKVFVVENHKLPRVSYTLVLDRDPILFGDKAGLTSLFGSVIMGGTKTKTKDQLDEAIDRIGARINVSATGASASGLKKHNDHLLALFSDVLFNSAFSAAELDKGKKQLISSLASNKDDQSSIVGVVKNAVMYGKDHPYGENETEKTVENINIEDIQSYYNTYFRPNIGYLAIVGDITVAEARTLVNKHFANWEKKEVPAHKWNVPANPTGTKVNIVNRSSSKQSAIDISYLVDLKQNNPDALGVAAISRIFGGSSSSRLFRNLRETRSFTYGAYGGISTGRLVGSLSAYADVGTNVTDSAANEFIYEIDRMAKGTITQEELDLAKAMLAGSFGRSLEQPSTIANFAINTEIYNLPKDHYKNYLKRLDALTLDEVNALARKYFTAENLHITIVGNADGFADKMARFGEIRYFTVDGDPEVKVEITDANITAESVVATYVEKIGGAAKLGAIKTFKSVSEASIQGMTLSIEQIVDQNKGIAVQNTKIGPQVLSQVRIENGKVTVTAQGQSQELPAEVASQYLDMLLIYPELAYAAKGYKLELDGINKIEGEDAYKVKITSPDNKVVTEYFSVASGLKLKTENPASGDMVYGKYMSFDGVLIPEEYTLTSPMMPMPIKAVAKTIELNGQITAEDLK